MPVWHKAIEKLEPEDREKITIVGIIQEQHADRCLLFAQWYHFDWPILHDPFNSLGLRAVPVTVAIDEYGIVRDTNPNLTAFKEKFVDREFADPDEKPLFSEPIRTKLRKHENKDAITKTSVGWQVYADSLILWDERTEHLDEAIEDYQRAVKENPGDASLLFHVGVAYRKRSESSLRQPDDFANAIRYWSEALELDPNHYIYRRRIQQYGPRLDKPYPFYDWVDKAIADIKARGEEPVDLKTMPGGAEIAAPQQKFTVAETIAESPDPDGKIDREQQGLVEVSAVVVPRTIKPGQSARIHVAFRLTADKNKQNEKGKPVEQLKAKWNNESDPMQVWIETADGWMFEQNVWMIDSQSAPESTEVRSIEFEIKAPHDFGEKKTFRGFALFNICETDGKCLFLRKDFEIEIQNEE